MPTGTVKWFNHTKAYGFIKSDQEEGPDIFVYNNALHASGIHTLKERDQVSYEIVNEKGKTEAVQLKIVP
ncbi:MAG: cold-shock protein [Rickettsiales endosymbiont of Dermacentor nuttalli]